MRLTLPAVPHRVRRPTAVTILAGLLLPWPPAHAAFFTRITDAANPVVTEMLETGGGAWADLDGDGMPELFVANGNLSNQNDALFLNRGLLDFLRVVTVPMASDGGSSIGGCWGDYDNDGVLDLFVTNRNFFGNFLYHGLGDTAFARVTTGPVATDRANSNSASWVDLNQDGALDLFIVNFQQLDDLYLNSGPPDFTLSAVDTGAVLGIATEFSIPGAWCDHDDDGDLDLFVGNAGPQDDALYVHQAGLHFTRTPLGDGRATLGASWGDVDNDGDLDLFTASYLNQVSLLYANTGAPQWALQPVAGTPFPANPGSAVGSGWGDFDNDADLDLFVARDGQDNLLFVNTGPPAYALERVDTLGVSSDGGASFGCSWVDVDDDGDLDLFVANRSNQVNFLYRNDGAEGSWLKLRLAGTASNRSALGARVRVLATIGGVPRWQVRDVEAQSGYNSQTLALHFGLGDAEVADSVIVRWPSGDADTLVHLPARGTWSVVEGMGSVVDVGSTMRGDSWRITRNPARDRLELVVELRQSSRVEIAVVDVAGRRWKEPRTLDLAAGTHRLTLPAGREHPGVYFARVRIGDEVTARRFVLMR